MRRYLASPRRRRRLLWAVVVLGAIGAAITLAVVYPNTAAQEKQANSPGQPESVPKTEPEPRTVALTPAARAAALETAGDFIKTAVLRQRVALSWQLTAPSLRAGYTREQWSTGNIPVVPYPLKSLASARWRLNHSYRDEVGLDVLLLPRETANVRPTTFEIDLKAVGSSRKHWLVESWTPAGVSTPSLTPSERRAAAAAVGPDNTLGATWLLAPVGLLLLLLVVPFAVLFRGWRANRRAERAYRQSLQL